MSLRLSNLQYPMLKALMRVQYMSIEDAQQFDQRPFRSMLIQEWAAYKPGKGFHATPAGIKAWEDYHHTSIARKNPMLPLTAYFDPTAYGLKLPLKKKKSVHVMPARSGAA